MKLCWDRGHETGGTSPGIPGWGYAGSECNLRLALGMTRLRSAKAYLGDGRHWSAVGHGAGYGIRDTGMWWNRTSGRSTTVLEELDCWGTACTTGLRGCIVLDVVPCTELPVGLLLDAAISADIGALNASQ